MRVLKDLMVYSAHPVLREHIRQMLSMRHVQSAQLENTLKLRVRQLLTRV